MKAPFTSNKQDEIESSGESPRSNPNSRQVAREAANEADGVKRTEHRWRNRSFAPSPLSAFRFYSELFILIPLISHVVVLRLDSTKGMQITVPVLH